MSDGIIGKKGVTPTGAVKKVSFGGTLVEFPVYRVSLKHLYYNDKNDRVATWMSQHIEDHGKLNNDNRDKYNNIIEQFIVDSNKGAFDRTYKNIKHIGQREAGVVLKDGRIIDGNRRFSKKQNLRSLSTLKQS